MAGLTVVPVWPTCLLWAIKPPSTIAREEPKPAQPQSAPSDGGWWSNAMDEPEEQPGGQSDPDSFLESVFSQLGEEDEQTEAADDDETGFSMGLLRRRRMGTAAKDINEG